MHAHFAVVGAGVAGLACATELVARGQGDVVLLEAGPRVGGAAETVRVRDYLIERGPNTVRRSPALDRLFECAGLEPQVARAAAPAFVARGRIETLPPRLGALVRGELLPRAAWLRMLAEPFARATPGEHSVRDWLRERLGNDFAERFADLLTLGIYGTSADRVGFEAAFPALAAALARSGGSLTGLALRRLLGREPSASRSEMVTSELGLGGLCERLGATLGERVRLRTRLRGVRPRAGGFELELAAAGETKLECRRLVLALPPSALARILGGTVLGSYKSVPQTIASFALEEPEAALRARMLGFLVPPREHLPLIGALLPSNLFDGRAPKGALLLSAFAGPALREASEAALARELAPLLKRLLGSVREPVLLDVARHSPGIPLYDPAHTARTRAFRESLPADSPLLCGYGWDGVGFADAAASGLAAAHRLLD